MRNTAILVALAIVLVGCGKTTASNTSSSTSSSSGTGGSGSSGNGSTPAQNAAKQWTWMGGSSSVPSGVAQPGVYGTQDVASSNNVPGGRYGSISWTDSSGNMWLFGGVGIFNGYLDDLWEFNPNTSAWTWVSGSQYANAPYAVGVYGTLGVAAATNVPGARYNAVSWIDKAGDLWLFGGFGINANGFTGYLNDLWKFNPAAKTWTWVSGAIPSNTLIGASGRFVGQTGVYGTQGGAAANNVPGSRAGSISWTDSAGNLWLFGGSGYDSTGTAGYLNDLWEFSPTTGEWTWISGTNTLPPPNPSGSAGQAGVYGTEGVAATTNVPGGRQNPIGWIDSIGNLWLFGGHGFDSAGTYGDLNDLWEFVPSANTWTWVSGSETAGAVGVFGTEGIAAAANVPGSRDSAVGWIDGSNNLWLFGGVFLNVSAGTASLNLLNDLWEFSSSAKSWTWVSGSNTPYAVGVYGTLGVAAATNVPSARSNAVSWIDRSGNFWLFGGSSFQNSRGQVYPNDLWRYEP